MKHAMTPLTSPYRSRHGSKINSLVGTPAPFQVSEGAQLGIKIPYPQNKVKKITRESINFFGIKPSDLRSDITMHKFDHIA